jgi:hypothetical protein
MAGKQIGEFSFKIASARFIPGPAAGTVVECNCEGTATGFGTVLGTGTFVVGKSGTSSWCGASYSDDGDIVTATGSGSQESIGKHRWRTSEFVQMSDGRALVAEGEFDLAARSWNGKLFEK